MSHRCVGDTRSVTQVCRGHLQCQNILKEGPVSLFLTIIWGQERNNRYCHPSSWDRDEERAGRARRCHAL